MKKLFILLIIINLQYVFAIEEQFYNNEDIIIKTELQDKNSLYKKNIPSIEINNKYENSLKDIKHLPWSMTERRIEYDSRGQAQFLPYALNDLNIQY